MLNIEPAMLVFLGLGLIWVLFFRLVAVIERLKPTEENHPWQDTLDGLTDPEWESWADRQ